MNRISRGIDFSLNVIFTIFSLMCVFPIILVLSVSFSSQDSIVKNGYRFIPEVFDSIAYKYIFADSAAIVRGYGVTIFVTVVGTILALLLMCLYAYPISRKDFPFKNGFTFFIVFTMLFSGGLVPQYLVYTKLLHLQNSIWVLIFPLLVSPFNVLVIRTFFKNTIPPSLIEAATIDGAGELRVFFQIILPLSLPVLATIALFTSIGYWNDWYNSLIYIDEAKLFSLQYLMIKAMRSLEVLKSLSTQTSNLSQAISKVPSEAVRMAMVIVGMGPIILAYPFFQKYFIKGLTLGAVKG